ncbi:FliA/WhiG family RNA polymerase sigma factor [Grimontia hollisae]|nr:FliA/WhiG family RNA polymerase sigma factor [Grimontia hollisae]AMG32145.2 FliA/WhiG family RNA polymerase sigma factor [Grimontia hollisae]MDF2183804.1 FliA/WhiG family RNA polymerase sigma factor [Grimontia hollisae]
MLMMNEVSSVGLHAYQQHQVGSKIREKRLLMQLSGLVKRVVNHLAIQADVVMNRDDMEQIGLMALLETIRRYPEEDEGGLKKLAVPRIRGALLDEMRRLDWRSRQLRQKTHQLCEKEREVAKTLGRAPTDPELAQAMEMSVSDVRQLRLDYEAERPHSFESMQEDNIAIPGLAVYCDHIEKEKLAVALKAALATLTEREQIVLSFYFEHEMSMKEIALVLDLTEARICQIQKKALATLNQKLSDWQLV